MIFTRFLALGAITFSTVLLMQEAFAAEGNVFKGKTQGQHELSQHEQVKIQAEFKKRFNRGNATGFQKLNNNPWEARRNKQGLHGQKTLQLTGSWGSCREFAYRQRGQCYARGSDAYTCERYYDARVSHCDKHY